MDSEYGLSLLTLGRLNEVAAFAVVDCAGDDLAAEDVDDLVGVVERTAHRRSQVRYVP